MPTDLRSEHLPQRNDSAGYGTFVPVVQLTARLILKVSRAGVIWPLRRTPSPNVTWHLTVETTEYDPPQRLLTLTVRGVPEPANPSTRRAARLLVPRRVPVRDTWELAPEGEHGMRITRTVQFAHRLGRLGEVLYRRQMRRIRQIGYQL